MAPALLAAYREAEYVVFGEPDLVLRIGQASPALDRLLEAHGAASAAYVTAANPRGRRRPAEENARATARLRSALEAAGHVCLPGEGRDPRGEWPAEPSLLVLGLSRAEAEALGRAAAQNAIVYVEKGRAPELAELA